MSEPAIDHKKLEEKLLGLRAKIKEYRETRNFSVLGEIRKLIALLEKNNYNLEQEKDELRSILIVEEDQWSLH